MRSVDRRLGGWRLGLLVALVLASGCQAPRSAAESAPVESNDPQVVAGKQLFVAKGCGACHRAPGVPEASGTIGPNLRGIGSAPKIAGVIDNTHDNLVRWLMEPQKMKPGTAMPGLGLSESDATAIAAYLETLK